MRTHANTLGDRNENVAGEITSTVHNMSNTNDNSRTTKKIRFRNLYNNKINESKPYDWTTKRVFPLLNLPIQKELNIKKQHQAGRNLLRKIQ